MSGCDIFLCLHYRPETVHCSIKDAHISEITFLALLPCFLHFYRSLLEKILQIVLVYKFCLSFVYLAPHSNSFMIRAGTTFTVHAFSWTIQRKVDPDRFMQQMKQM